MNHPGRWWLAILCSLAWLGPGSTATAQEVPRELQQKINRAVDRGVQALKQMRGTNGLWQKPGENNDIGPTALAAWTLLESGVDPNDPIIKDSAGKIREAAASERKTYNVSLALIFLDRLGDPQDEVLIESLGVRLMACQNLTDFGWGYYGPEVPAAEQRRLKDLIARRNQDVRLQPRNPSKKAPGRDWGQVSAGTRAYLRQWVDGKLGPPPAGRSDNSNTQFAMIAVWLAGRHGLPVQGSIAGVERRFRSQQIGADGGWGYDNTPNVPAPARTYGMTPAGLLGIYLGHASDRGRARDDILKDPAVAAGMAHLHRIMNFQVPGKDVEGTFNYFLWSLERMAVAYDIKKIQPRPTAEGIDWYQWGAELLVERQQPRGGWPGAHSQYGADTCFALLFLKKVDLVEMTPTDLEKFIEDKKGPPPRKIGPEDPIDLKSFIPKEDTRPGPGRSSRRWTPQALQPALALALRRPGEKATWPGK